MLTHVPQLPGPGSTPRELERLLATPRLTLVVGPVGHSRRPAPLAPRPWVLCWGTSWDAQPALSRSPPGPRVALGLTSLVFSVTHSYVASLLLLLLLFLP